MSEPSTTNKLNVPPEVEKAADKRIEEYLLDWLKGLDRYFDETTDEEVLRKIARGESATGESVTGGSDKGWSSPRWSKDK